MNTQRSLASDVSYLVRLIRAGRDGVTFAPRPAENPPLKPALTRTVWAATAIGAAVGAWSASRQRSRRSAYRLAVSGLIGSVCGFGCGMAWASRSLTGTAARSAIREINMVRDMRWLEKNPIDYA